MARKSTRKKPAQAKPDALATAVAQDGVADPTLLTSEVAVSGRRLTLCFDLGSLARAEHELRAAGHDVNVLSSLPGTTVQDVMVMFAVAVRRFHPDIAFEAALKMLAISDLYKVRLAIADAWRRSLPEPEAGDKKNPTRPGR